MSVCHIVLRYRVGPDVTGYNLSEGFQAIFTSPQPLYIRGTLFYQPRNFKLAKVQQFNVNVERQIPGNVVVTVGYAGARGNHILVAGNNLNTFGPTNCSTGTIGCNPDGTPFVPPSRQPTAAVLAFGDFGKTTYDSLQIKAETKTPKYGLYALIGYTYSHTS